MAYGIIKFFNRKKGFGYIIEDDTNSDLFVHITGFADKKANIKTGEKVIYIASENQNGRCATEVERLVELEN